MNSTFKLLSFGACVALASLVAGCSTGSDDSDANGGAGGAGTGTGGKTNGGASGQTELYGFNADTQDFTLNTTASGDPMYVNLAASGASATPPTIGWTGTKDFDSAAVAPNKGCLLLTATFTGWNQSVTAEVAGPADSKGNFLDLSGKTLRAQVLLDKGLSPFTTGDAPGGVVFFIKSGTNYTWGQAPWANLQNYGSWTSVKFNTDNPDSGSKEGWDPSNPVQFGFQISSGGGNTHTAAEFGEPLETSVCIDHITVQDN